jgi:hypothetical protein
MTRGVVIGVVVAATGTMALPVHPASPSTPIPQADSQHAKEMRPTPVDAFRGHLVWSHLDPTLRRFRLLHRFKGRTETLPIRSRGVVFDADLGPDRRNRVALVYSRCSGLENPRFGTGFSHFRGCDLFRYDFETRRETRLRKLSTPASSERFPSLCGDRVAFLRSTHGQRTLLVGDLRSGALQVVPVRAPHGVQSLDDLELHRRHLAFIWTTRIPFRPHAAALASIELHTQVWLHDLATNTPRLLSREHYVTIPSRTYLSPSFEGGYVYFGVRTGRFTRAGKSRVFRWPLIGGPPQHAALPDPIISVQRDRGAFAYVLGADREPVYGWPCSVGFTDVLIGNQTEPRFCTVGSLRQVRFS